MSKAKDVVIIGAGAVGCSIAYHLGKRGVASTIIEKESIGSRASGKAWAVISYPPIIMAAAVNPDSYFGMPDGESVTAWQDLYWSAYYRLESLSQDIFEKSQVDIAYGSVPMIQMAASEPAEKGNEMMMAYLKANNYSEHEWLDENDLKAMFPGILPQVRSGLMIPQLQVEPYKYTLGLGQASEAMGAEIKSGDVRGFETNGQRIKSVTLASGNRIEGDIFIIAMGPWSGAASGWLGQEVPMYITMEECLRVKSPPNYPLRSLTCGLEIISRIDGDLILAVAEVQSKMHYFESKKREDFDDSLSDEIKTVNIERAMSLLPELLKDAELVEHRGDLLAYGPAPYFHKPVLGRFPNWENGYIASRFGGYGINMSIGAGETMAHLIVDSEAPFETKQMVEILSPE